MPQGVKIIAPIVTLADSDSYATHLASLGKGGLRTVDDIPSRNSIAVDRQEEGMLVYVKSDSTFYQLVQTGDPLQSLNWQEANFGGSASISSSLLAEYITGAGDISVIDQGGFLYISGESVSGSSNFIKFEDVIGQGNVIVSNDNNKIYISGSGQEINTGDFYPISNPQDFISPLK